MKMYKACFSLLYGIFSPPLPRNKHDKNDKFANNSGKEVTKMANRNNSNQLVVPGSEQALNQMKTEIAQEFGVQLSADTTSRGNGSVGGEITKRLVQQAQQQFGAGQ